MLLFLFALGSLVAHVIVTVVAYCNACIMQTGAHKVKYIFSFFAGKEDLPY